jgi:hypothetical protein
LRHHFHVNQSIVSITHVFLSSCVHLLLEKGRVNHEGKERH